MRRHGRARVDHAPIVDYQRVASVDQVDSDRLRRPQLFRYGDERQLSGSARWLEIDIVPTQESALTVMRLIDRHKRPLSAAVFDRKAKASRSKKICGVAAKKHIFHHILKIKNGIQLKISPGANDKGTIFILGKADLNFIDNLLEQNYNILEL